MNVDSSLSLGITINFKGELMEEVAIRKIWLNAWFLIESPLLPSTNSK
jgi:hypothetical protein